MLTKENKKAEIIKNTELVLLLRKERKAYDWKYKKCILEKLKEVALKEKKMCDIGAT